MKAIVCFGPSKNKLLQSIFKEDFQHCFVVLYPQDCVVIVDPTVDNINITVCKQEVLHTKMRPIRYAVEVDIGEAEQGILGLHSCVSHVKRIIGINKWWIITPQQLFKELVRGYF